MKDIFKPFVTILKLAPVSAFLYVLLVIVTGLVAPAAVYVNQNFIDTTWNFINGVEGNLNDLVIVCVLMATIILLPGLLSVLKTFVHNKVEWNLCQKFDVELMQKKMNIKFELLEDKETQLILKKMSEPKWAVLKSFDSLCTVGKSLLTIAGLATFFLQMNYVVTILLAVMFVVILITNILEQNRNVKQIWWEAEDRRLWNAYYGMFSNSNLQQERRTFINDAYLFEKYDKQTEKLNRIKMKVQLKNALGHLFVQLLEVGLFAYILFTSIDSMIAGDFTIGFVSASLVAIGSYIGASSGISRSFAQISRFKQETKYYNEYMQLPNRDIGINPLPENFEIEFKNVCFSYPKTEKQILKNINLTFSPKKKIAIVGENGSGKSTMIKLLAGLYKPTGGSITVGGVDINSLTDEARFDLFGFIFQDINTYSVPLRESIAVGGSMDVNNDEALKAALKSANAEGLLDKVDGNLDAMIGYRNEQGLSFSGGECQKLQVSRVFLRPHKFVVLDEPVASLDANSESKMYESFLKHFKSCGAIVISHRLASAKMADEIILLEQGTVSAIGSHDKLMKSSKLYNNMFTLQASQYTGESAKEEVKIEKRKTNRKKV